MMIKAKSISLSTTPSEGLPGALSRAPTIPLPPDPTETAASSSAPPRPTALSAQASGTSGVSGFLRGTSSMGGVSSGRDADIEGEGGGSGAEIVAGQVSEPRSARQFSLFKGWGSSGDGGGDNGANSVRIRQRSIFSFGRLTSSQVSSEGRGAARPMGPRVMSMGPRTALDASRSTSGPMKIETVRGEL